MERIGRFKGVPCYKCTQEEFIKTKLFFDTNNVYIIGEQMVKSNRVIGIYDGRQVMEKDVPYRVYYSINMADARSPEYSSMRSKEREKKERPSNRQEESREQPEEIDFNKLMNQIKFEDYTTEVDNFFANL